MEDRVMAQLKAALSEEEYIALLEHFAGCRVYICANPKISRVVTVAIGLAGAEKLERRFGMGLMRVPLDRETRIRHYASKGLSAALIAVRLGMTENGVFKALSRYGITRARNTTSWRGAGGRTLEVDTERHMAMLPERSTRTR